MWRHRRLVPPGRARRGCCNGSGNVPPLAAAAACGNRTAWRRYRGAAASGAISGLPATALLLEALCMSVSIDSFDADASIWESFNSVSVRLCYPAVVNTASVNSPVG